METDSFIRIGSSFDFLYHFNVKYNFKYKDKNYKGCLYYFSNRINIDEKDRNLMIHMFNTTVKYIKDHHNIKTKKGEQLEIGLNFDKKGKLGFKEIEDEFLSKIPIDDVCVKWC
jgi:oligoendopeptidase F